MDPVIDPGDPQQMNAYAYANNAPATMSDPDGLRFVGDSEGHDVATPAAGGGYKIYNSRTGVHSGKDSVRRNKERAERDLNAARERQEALKRKLINAGKLFLDILLEVTGAKAGIDCFMKGDVGGCIETAVTVLSSLVGGLLVKIGAKYALKWKAAAKLFGKVKKLVTDIADVIKGWGKAADDLADAQGAVAKAANGARSRAFQFGNLPPGVLGSTDELGNITIQRGLTGTAFKETLRHETVHSVLTPRAPFKKLTVGLYNKSGLYRYTEEALAEGYALRSVRAGLAFPLREGYVSGARLGLEAGGGAVALGGAAYWWSR